MWYSYVFHVGDRVQQPGDGTGDQCFESNDSPSIVYARIAAAFEHVECRLQLETDRHRTESTFAICMPEYHFGDVDLLHQIRNLVRAVGSGHALVSKQ